MDGRARVALAGLWMFLCLGVSGVLFGQQEKKDVRPPGANEALQSAEGLYGMARQAERKNDLTGAIVMYKELLVKYPTHYRAGCGLVCMGFDLMTLQRYDEAIEAFRRAIREFPEARFKNNKLAAERAAYLVAICLYKKGDKDEAMAAVDEATNKYPDATAGDDEGRPMGDLILEMADQEEARHAGGNKTKVKPLTGDPGTDLYLYAGNFMKEKPEEALRLYDELLVKYPKHELTGAALVNAGELLRMAGHYDQAIERFRKALETYPSGHYFGGAKKIPIAPDAAWLIGVAYYNKGDMPNAKKAFDFALQKYPDARLGDKLRSEIHAQMIREVNEANAVPRGKDEQKDR